MNNAAQHPQVVQIWKTIKAKTLLDEFEVANVYETEAAHFYSVEVIADEESMFYTVNPSKQIAKIVK